MNKGYLRFTNERNSILQKILNRQHAEITYQTDLAFLLVKDQLTEAFNGITDDNRFTSRARALVHTAAYHIDLIFTDSARAITAIIKKYAKISKDLTHAGELEAIARLKRKRYAMKPTEFKFHVEQVYERVRLPFAAIQNKLFVEMDRAYVRGLTTSAVVEKFRASLPEKVKIKQEIKPIRQTYFSEADKISVTKEDYTVSTITDDEWNTILDSYKNEFIPQYRYAKDVKGYLYKYDDKYAWEVEQTANHEFLQQYKEGVVAAGGDGNATDILWVAVMDDRTRHEHAMRDGLTSSEIQEKLDNEWSDEEEFPDRAIVPPSGFNCRCRAVPYIAEADIETSENDNLFSTEEFTTWLNT